MQLSEHLPTPLLCTATLTSSVSPQHTYEPELRASHGALERGLRAVPDASGVSSIQARHTSLAGVHGVMWLA